MLSYRVGVEHIEVVEDAVQSALMTALEAWPRKGLPDNPSAWLYRVAKNELVGALRQSKRREHLLERRSAEDLLPPEIPPEAFLSGEVGDDLLRMLFACCDDSIPEESQLVMALKTLCGFDVREISLRLFTTEANVYKRLSRARSRFREHPPRLEDFTDEQITSRLPAIRRILYVLFTEGYLSSHTDYAIRAELCQDAIRLGDVLINHRLGRSPESHALLALMHLHSARIGSRKDGAGGLLLLEEQDRSLWDQEQIRRGLELLGASAEGGVFSRYHAEAGIAAEHCLAPTYEATRWDRVVECYELLEAAAPSPIHTLNRAVASAEWLGPEAGLKILNSFNPPTWLADSFLWAAVLADLWRRSGNSVESSRYRELAIDAAPTEAIRQLLQRRLRHHS